MFEVVFQGKILAGADMAQVRQSLGRMFKADEAKLNALFSGKTVVIKSGLDQPTAQKYLAALNKAGAQAEVREIGAVSETPTAKNPASFLAKEFTKPSLTSVAQAQDQQNQALYEEDEKPSAPVSKEIPVPEVKEASSEDIKRAMDALAKKEAEAESSSSSMASTGVSSLKDEPLVQSTTPVQNTSQDVDLTIAPVGSVLLPDAKESTAEAPSTDHLTIRPMEGYLVDPEPEKKVQVPDVSHLKIEE